MAVVIRLNVRGRKHLAFHKVVVADSRAPRDGRHIEILGHYDPLRDPAEFIVDEARTKYWLEKGAQPSEKVAALLRAHGIRLPEKMSKPKKKKERTKPAASKVAASKAARAKSAAKKAAPKKAKPAKKKAEKKS
ncbi:MAG: 30S ribosomal protein S16 [Candidatus Eisenbacteria bacterium]|nr:30S ribosomal protein S16 [Candidatus Eisenbacteria bacterium]